MTTARPVPLRAGIAPRKLAVSAAAAAPSAPASAPRSSSRLPQELGDALAALAKNVGSSTSPSLVSNPARSPAPSQPATAIAPPQSLTPLVEPTVAVAAGPPVPAPPVQSITQPSNPHPPPRMPSRPANVSGFFRPAIASAGSLAPVVSPPSSSVTMPSPGSFMPAPVPSWVDPVGPTAPAFAVPQERPSAPVHVPLPPAPQAYERAFRRWSRPNFEVPEDIPSAEPLSYQVYTPEALSSRPRLGASDRSERAPLPGPSLAMRLGAAALGVACVVGVALVALLATGDEPDASATAAAQPAEPPAAVVDAIPSNVVVAPAPPAPVIVVEPAAPALAAPAKAASAKAAKKAASGAAARSVLAANPNAALAGDTSKK